MPLYLVKLDDRNASHPYREEEVVADNPELAGQQALETCGCEKEMFEVASVEQLAMDQKTMVGILDPQGRLLDASDCNSQIEGSPFDGPCLWPDLKSAQNDNDDYGGLCEDHKYVNVTITINEILEEVED